MSVLGWVRLASRAGWLAVSGRRADCTADYNRASGDYDAFFSRVMGGHAAEVLQRMSLEPEQHVLELACGTGHITAQIATRLGGQGAITAVDKSAGMLAVARQKLTGFDRLHLTFQQDDMTTFLRRLPAAGVDAVVCGWAICYGQPVRLLREMARVLRPGGQVGIIETRRDSLAVLRHAIERVLVEDPSLLQRYIQLNLPTDTSMLRRWFTRAQLVPEACWEGEHALPCRDADEALEWVRRSGAAAGFIDAFDRQREPEVLDRLRRAIDGVTGTPAPLTLTHTYVAGVARLRAA